jgi:hypothetical protein
VCNNPVSVQCAPTLIWNIAPSRLLDKMVHLNEMGCCHDLIVETPSALKYYFKWHAACWIERLDDNNDWGT